MIRIFAIPYAFGGAYIYDKLSKELANDMELIPIEYSGHSQRYIEPLYNNINEIAKDVYDQIADKLDCDYAILGYSMGGTVTYELQRILKENGRKPPMCIMAFGSTEPEYKHRQHDFEKYDLNDVKNLLKDYEGTPPEVLESDELIDFIKPVVINDCIALRDYVPLEPKDNSISVPLVVLRGADEQKKENCESGWKKYCNSFFSYHVVDGGHFFMFENDGKRTGEFAGIIEKIIRNGGRL